MDTGQSSSIYRPERCEFEMRALRWLRCADALDGTSSRCAERVVRYADRDATCREFPKTLVQTANIPDCTKAIASASLP